MLTGHGVSTRQAATLTGLVRSTATRRRNAATALTPAVCTEPAVEPANKLTDAERRRVVEVLTSDRFVDLAPLQIYAQLLDEGVYLCSVSTMYRVLGQHTLVAERRRLARHPSQVCPELVATAPQQVYSWDITKLAGPVKGTYFDAYVMIDIYSRYLVGVHVHAHESGVLARELIDTWTPRTPFDHVGQHLYIDVGRPTTEEKLRFYLDDSRDAYLSYEGVESPKMTDITEFGWSTKDVSQELQAENLLTAFDTFREVG